MEKFKIGDKVKIIGNRSSFAQNHGGEVGIVIEVSDGYCILDIEVDSEHRSGVWNTDLILTNEKSAKPKPEDFVRYMVYGIGCDNKSDFYTSEKEMSEKARSVARDEEWIGDIIGYKLTPMFKVEKKTILKKFKNVVSKKKKTKR